MQKYSSMPQLNAEKNKNKVHTDNICRPAKIRSFYANNMCSMPSSLGGSVDSCSSNSRSSFSKSVEDTGTERTSTSGSKSIGTEVWSISEETEHFGIQLIQDSKVGKNKMNQPLCIMSIWFGTIIDGTLILAGSRPTEK